MSAGNNKLQYQGSRQELYLDGTKVECGRLLLYSRVQRTGLVANSKMWSGTQAKSLLRKAGTNAHKRRLEPKKTNCSGTAQYLPIPPSSNCVRAQVWVQCLAELLPCSIPVPGPALIPKPAPSKYTLKKICFNKWC